MDDETERPLDQLEADEQEHEEHEDLGDAGSSAFGSLLGSGGVS